MVIQNVLSDWFKSGMPMWLFIVLLIGMVVFGALTLFLYLKSPMTCRQHCNHYESAYKSYLGKKMEKDGHLCKACQPKPTDALLCRRLDPKYNGPILWARRKFFLNGKKFQTEVRG